MLSWHNRTGVNGSIIVYTGKYDSRDTARYLMWNGQFSISGWRTPYAMNCFDQDISLIIKMSLSMVLKCISSDFHRNNWRKLIKILDSIWMLLMEYWTSLLCTHWVCQQYCIRVYMYTCACMSIKCHLTVTVITVSLVYVVFNWQVHYYSTEMKLVSNYCTIWWHFNMYIVHVL